MEMNHAKAAGGAGSEQSVFECLRILGFNSQLKLWAPMVGVPPAAKLEWEPRLWSQNARSVLRCGHLTGRRAIKHNRP